MKCNEIEKSKPRHQMNLNNLDKALHELGMLSTITEARRDYLRETKSNYNVMRLNSHYISKATVGYWMKRSTNRNRLCPYVLPMRHRTKSENSETVGNDANDSLCEYKHNLLEPSTSGCSSFELKYPTKRCQSLENLNLAVDPQPGPETSPEMDCVSTQIQKLQVDE